MSETKALDALAARLPRVAPFNASRDRPALLTPARARFDGTFPKPPEPPPGAEAATNDVPLPPLDLGRKKKKPPKDGPFIVRSGDGAPEAEEAMRAEIVAACADTTGMLARHRAERPMHELAKNEAELLTQIDALAISGGECVRSLVLWWRDNADDPWKAWATVFALASLDGIDVLQAIAREIEVLEPDMTEYVAPIAEALLVAPHPHVPDLARDLLASESPIARAIAIDVLGRRGALAVEQLRPHLEDPHLAVVAAAVRAHATVPPAIGVPILFKFLAHKDPTVAWPAARQLLVWGRPEPYFEVRAGRGESLEQWALEVLVYAGNSSDLELFERILARAPASGAQISALARFGAPSAWAFLLHHLANEELEDAAVRALTTLFGERVPVPERKKPAAWRSAIAQAKLDPNVRYRHGEPWRPRAVAAECVRGNFPRAEMRVRLDELTVRTGMRPAAAVDLGQWAPETWGGIKLAAEIFEKADGTYPPGTWTTRTR
jgi:hypothetical protein